MSSVTDESPPKDKVLADISTQMKFGQNRRFHKMSENPVTATHFDWM